MQKEMKFGIEEKDIKLAEEYAHVIKNIGENFTGFTGVDITGKLSDKSMNFLKIFDSQLNQIIAKSGGINVNLVKNPKDILYLEDFAEKLGKMSLGSNAIDELENYVKHLEQIEKTTANIQKNYKEIDKNRLKFADIKLAEEHAQVIKNLSEKFAGFTGVDITGKLSDKSITFLNLFDSKLDQIISKSGGINLDLVKPKDILFLEDFVKKLGEMSLGSGAIDELESYVQKLEKISKEAVKIKKNYREIEEQAIKKRLTESLQGFTSPTDITKKPKNKAEKELLEPTVYKEIEKRIKELNEAIGKVDIKLVKNPTDLIFLENLSKKVKNISLDANAVSELEEYIKKLNIISKKTPEFYEQEAKDIEAKKRITEKLFDVPFFQKQKEAEFEVEKTTTAEVTEKKPIKTEVVVDIKGTDLTSTLFKEIEKKVDEVRKVAGNINLSLVKDPTDLIFLENLQKRLKSLSLDENAISQLEEYLKKLREVEKKQLPAFKRFTNMSLFNISNLLKAAISLKTIKMIAQGIKEIFITMFPLALLASIGAFVRGMIEADKQTKTLMRSFMNLAAQGNEIYNFGGGGEGFKKTMKVLRTSTMDFAKRWGITFDEAQQRLEQTAGSGIFLSELLGSQAERTNSKISKVLSGSSHFNMKLADDIQAMATFSGKSFGEMANEVGAWKNEFGIAVEDSLALFTKLKRDAGKTGLVTGKYFEKVMNAAGSLVVYGNRLQDVSSLYSDLAKAMNMPKEAAAELAKTLLKGPQEFAVEQRVLNAMLGNSHKLLQEQLVRYQKELKTATGAEAKKIQERINNIKFTLDAKNFPNKMEQLRAEFETLDPRERLIARVEALKKAMGSVGEKFNIFDPKAAGEFITSWKSTMLNVGQPLGVDEGFLNALQKTFEGLTSNSENLKKLSATFDVGSEDLMNAMLSQDAGEVGKVLKPAFQKLGWDPVKIKSAFKDAGLGELVKGLDLSNKDKNKVLHLVSNSLAAVDSAFSKLGLGGGGKDGKGGKAGPSPAEIAAASLKMAKDTTAIKDVLENTMTELQFGMLDGITGILHFSKGIFKTVKMTFEGFKRSKLFKWVAGDTEKAEALGNLEEKIAELSGDKESRMNYERMIKEEKAKPIEEQNWDKITQLTKAMNKAGDPNNQKKMDHLMYVKNQLEKGGISSERAQAELNVMQKGGDVDKEAASIYNQRNPMKTPIAKEPTLEGTNTGPTQHATPVTKFTAFLNDIVGGAVDHLQINSNQSKLLTSVNEYLKSNQQQPFNSSLGMKQAYSDKKDPLHTLVKSHVDGIKAQYPNVDFGMASGGIVLPRPGGTRAIIGEAGRPEAVIPLDQIDKIFQRYNVKNEEKPKLQTILDSITKMRIELKNNSISVNPVPPTQIVQEKPQVQNVVNNNEKTNASTTNNVYNTTISVKNGDPQVIEKVVRQVLYEREV